VRSRFLQSSPIDSPVASLRPQGRSILQNKVLTVLDPVIRSLTADNTSALITYSKLVADAAIGCSANSQPGLSAKSWCYPGSRTNADTSHACTDAPDATRDSSNACGNAPDSSSDTARNSSDTSRSSKRNAASHAPADPEYFSDDGHSNHRTLLPSLKRII